MGERDQLSNRQITDESNLSAKRLSLLEAKNRQASRKQAETKIEEYKKDLQRLQDEIQVGSIARPFLPHLLILPASRIWKTKPTLMRNRSDLLKWSFEKIDTDGAGNC